MTSHSVAKSPFDGICARHPFTVKVTAMALSCLSSIGSFNTIPLSYRCCVTSPQDFQCVDSRGLVHRTGERLKVISELQR